MTGEATTPTPPGRRPWLAGVAARGRVRLGAHRRGLLLVALGTLLFATGLGLAPHLVKDTVSLTAVVALALVVGGIAGIAAGARGALEGRRRPTKVAGGVVVVLVVVLAAWVVAPAVAATNVPPTEVGSTPAARGLPYEAVTVRTADGVELAAWYLRGTNGAGVVVTHGAGSTRSDVLDQTAVIVENGYSAVLIDARGHGDSGGTAMDFGWYGDLDVEAGTDLLASRAEIDPDRIGVVGFSMGGEEAIGAAASDPRIRAVVAEGATARQAADEQWLSDAYGWRGWLQEQLETVQDGVTDLLTEASPPTPLRSAMAEAPQAQFLLITAGAVEDEGRAAAAIRTGAPDRVTVWTVDDADHTGGLDTRPDDWERRVVGFLDENLA